MLPRAESGTIRDTFTSQRPGKIGDGSNRKLIALAWVFGQQPFPHAAHLEQGGTIYFSSFHDNPF